MSTPGTNTLLLGAPGSGKTHSIRTLIDAGLEVFCLFTEPLGMEILADTPEDKLHWHYVPPAAPSFQAMIDSAKKINMMTFEDLSKLKSGINKREYNQFIEVLATLSNFECQRCGEAFGSVDTWDSSRALVIDSLSGLNIMALDLVCGSKPTKAMGEWGVAMDNLERLINKLCADTECFFVLTGHLEREVDEVTGGVQLMASTLGRKLAPRLPRFFSDVVLAKRNGDKFAWSTITQNVDLKARNLPWADNLPPTFTTIVDNWRKHNDSSNV